MGQKQTFVTGLADVNPNNKDGLGSIRVENNAVYKYVQFSGTTAVNIGDAVCYVVAASDGNAVIVDNENSSIGAGVSMCAVPTGSYLGICHLTADFYPEMTEVASRVNERQPHAPLTLRDRDQVARLFNGLQLVPPGLVQCSKWRPDSDSEAAAPAALWGGVACKDFSAVTRNR